MYLYSKFLFPSPSRLYRLVSGENDLSFKYQSFHGATSLPPSLASSSLPFQSVLYPRASKCLKVDRWAYHRYLLRRSDAPHSADDRKSVAIAKHECVELPWVSIQDIWDCRSLAYPLQREILSYLSIPSSFGSVDPWPSKMSFTSRIPWLCITLPSKSNTSTRSLINSCC